MAPLLEVRVRDAYIGGGGMMQVKMFSLLPMVDEHDRVELDEAALQRFLAEAVWLPTALLPREGLAWSPIDERRALATLTDGATTVSLEFQFNDSGEVSGIFSPGRYREFGGEYLPTPWKGRFSGYQERWGIRIPIDGEVEWLLPGGEYVYWKARIVDVEYEFAR